MTNKNELKISEERKKELFYKLLTKEDVVCLLKMLDEGGTKGAENFQRMKIKNLLNLKSAQRGKKFSPWDFIKKTIGIPNMTDEQKENVVTFLKTKASEAPAFVRFIVLMNEAEDFFNENFETFVTNVENEKDFMQGIWVKQSQEEVLEQFLAEFNKEGDALMDGIIDTTKMLSSFGEEMLELKALLEGVELEDYEAVEQELVEKEYPPALILFVYLVAGSYPQELKVPIYYLATERIAKFMAKNNLINKIKTELENDSNNQKDKGIKKVLKKTTQEKKRLEEELSQLKETYEEDKAETLQKIDELQKTIKQLSIQDVSQKKQIEEFERQMGGYTMNLADDLSELKMVVGHTSPLMYAPLVFPEIKFMAVNELINGVQKKSVELVAVQQNGLSYMEFKKIADSLNDKGIEWVEIDALEERRVIIELSNIIKNKLM